MNMLMADIQLPAGDITASPRSTQAVPAEGQRTATEFAGVLRSSLMDNSPGKSSDVSQVIDLTIDNSPEAIGVEGQLLNWQAQQVAETLPGTIELETDSMQAILAGGVKASDLEPGSVLEISLAASQELVSEEGGMSLPPVAALDAEQTPQQDVLTVTSESAVILPNGLSPAETLPAAVAKAVTVPAPVPVVAADNAGVIQAAVKAGVQPGPSLDGQEAANQADSRPFPPTNNNLAMPPDPSVEQAVSEIKVNTLLQGNQNAAASGMINAAAAVSSSVAASAPAATTSSLLDASSVSLQGMSLGRGETSGEIGSNLADRVQWMINHRQNTANIRLDPPLLGRLDVQVKVVDDVATVTIHTQHGLTRDLVDAASYRLRDALQESGFQSVNVDVSHREETNQAANQQFSDTSTRQAVPTEFDHDSDSAGAETWMSGYAAPGLIDTFA